MWDTWCLGGDTDGCYFEFESKQSSFIISFSYQRNFYALQITSLAMHHLYVICHHERDISPIHQKSTQKCTNEEKEEQSASKVLSITDSRLCHVIKGMFDKL